MTDRIPTNVRWILLPPKVEVRVAIEIPVKHPLTKTGKAPTKPVIKRRSRK